MLGGLPPLLNSLLSTMATAETFPGGQEDGLTLCALLLKEECDQTQYPNAINTLLKILRNVLSNPTEAKYHELKPGNKTFWERVWQFTAAQQFLVASGWAEVDDKVMLVDDQFLSRAIAVLENASRALPAVNGATGVAVQPPRQQSQVQSQKDKVMDESRRKHMEQLRIEKEERQRIAEMIKADRQETETRKHKASVARPRQFGANINRFEDIGVDLNKGGGG